MKSVLRRRKELYWFVRLTNTICEYFSPVSPLILSSFFLSCLLFFLSNRLYTTAPCTFLTWPRFSNNNFVTSNKRLNHFYMTVHFNPNGVLSNKKRKLNVINSHQVEFFLLKIIFILYWFSPMNLALIAVAAVLYLAFGWGNDFLCNLVGFLYPAYAS